MLKPTEWHNDPVETKKGIHLLTDYGRKYSFLSAEISTSIIVTELNKLNWIKYFYQFIVVTKPGISMEVSGSLNNPRKISCSQFLAQALDSTALQKNIRLTYG